MKSTNRDDSEPALPGLRLNYRRVMHGNPQVLLLPGSKRVHDFQDDYLAVAFEDGQFVICEIDRASLRQELDLWQARERDFERSPSHKNI